MVSCCQQTSWWEEKCEGIKYHSTFTATRGGTGSGSYVVRVFKAPPDAAGTRARTGGGVAVIPRIHPHSTARVARFGVDVEERVLNERILGEAFTGLAHEHL